MQADGDGTPAQEGERYTGDEIGYFVGALASARDQFEQLARELARANGVGPRGPWIIGLIDRHPASPHELAMYLGIGRSLITAELRQLQEAGLIHYARNPRDGRRVELSLTPGGMAVRDLLDKRLQAMMEERLAGYSKAQVMACARLLGDFGKGNRYVALPKAVSPPDADEA